MATQTPAPTKEELFPSIRDLAEKADKLPDVPDEEMERLAVSKPDGGAEGVEGGEDDDADRPLQEIESLCMKCEQQGTTRLLLTSIPFFKEVVVMSFRCEHCGFSNNEIQSAGTIRPEGTLYTTHILSRSDLDRQIVRSPTCEVSIPEFQLVLPPSSRGQLTTVEGLVRDIIADLSMDQPLRKYQDPASYETIETLLGKLGEIIGSEEELEEGARLEALGKASEKDEPMPKWTLKLDDPAGNSFVEFVENMSDPKWNLKTYHRTREQNVMLGLVAEDEEGVDAEAEDDGEIDNEEVFIFPGSCSSCGHSLDTKMKKVNIPYFQEIIIMSTNCDRCGYRDNEVKAGGAINEKGRKITLKVEDKEDLSRDILKSETAGLVIPEIDLVLTHGTLGGRFTTVEGILDQVYEELSDKVYRAGDSTDDEDRKKFEGFLEGLKSVKEVTHPFTLILDDPLANSYLQNLYAPDEDPNMTVEWYERSWEQNEELGLNDIKVEGYEEEHEKEKEQAKAGEGEGPKKEGEEMAVGAS